MGEGLLVVDIDPERPCLVHHKGEVSREQHGFFQVDADDILLPCLEDFELLEFLDGFLAGVDRHAEELVHDEGAELDALRLLGIEVRVADDKDPLVGGIHPVPAGR